MEGRSSDPGAEAETGRSLAKAQASASAAAGADAGYIPLAEMFTAVVTRDASQGPAILKECRRLGF